MRDSVRIFNERGTFHRGIYDLPEFYEIDVIKIKGRGKKKENLNYQIQIIISDQVLWSNIWGN